MTNSTTFDYVYYHHQKTLVVFHIREVGADEEVDSGTAELIQCTEKGKTHNPHKGTTKT